jgi:hypothetical protein
MKEETLEKPTPMLFKIIIFLLFVFAITALVFSIDSYHNEGKYTNSIAYKKSCDVLLPSNVSIEWSDLEQAYAVRITGGSLGVEYLNDTRTYGIVEYPLSISRPTLFLDSCRAKSFYLVYLKEKQGSTYGFKN